MVPEPPKTLTLSRSGWHTRLKENQVKPLVTMLIAATLGVEFLLQGSAYACAVCGVDGESGFLWSMGFLISMPFLIASITGGYFIYNSRRGKKPPVNKRIFSE